SRLRRRQPPDPGRPGRRLGDVGGQLSGRPMRLPSPCLVMLIGPSGAGKSQWAAEHFRPGQIVSSDTMRALVGEGEHDQRAGKDAFDVLNLVLERRLARGLVTVVDT